MLVLIEAGTMLFVYDVSMTPFRLRLFLLTFCAVAAGITFNALYMQGDPHLAGTAIRAPEQDHAQTASPSVATASLPKSDPASVALRSEAATAPERFEILTNAADKPERRAPIPAETVRAVERELARKGYDPGPIDGRADLQTRAAIIAFEFDEGLPLRGEPDEDILKALIFAAAAGGPGTGSSDRFERKDDLVMQVQQILAQMGYASGPIDGRLDETTRDAIRKFEADRNLEGEGRLTARVLLELVIVAGHPLGAKG